jgi:hypothetical protein
MSVGVTTDQKQTIGIIVLTEKLFKNNSETYISINSFIEDFLITTHINSPIRCLLALFENLCYEFAKVI